MRRMCGKSLYQEASAARRTDNGKRVESAKDRATKIAHRLRTVEGPMRTDEQATCLS